MTRKLTATEAKAKILTLLDEVAAGDEVEITKHGRTVARLVPSRGRGKPRPYGSTVCFAVATTSSEISRELRPAAERCS